MTSYANANESSTSNATRATTTTTTSTSTTPCAIDSQIGDVFNEAVTTVKQNNDSGTLQQQQQQHFEQHQQQQDLSDCDEGEEKADSTPENIKKIDDIIELELERERIKQQLQQLSQQQQQQQQKERSTAMNDGTVNSTSDVLALGLAVAIDESNEKFCFVRKPTTPPSSTTEATTATTTKTSLCNEKAKTSLCKTADKVLVASTPSTSSSIAASLTTNLMQSSKTNNYKTNDDSSTASNITKATTTAQESDNNAADNGKRSACAFTLSFDNDNSKAAVTAARYKSVMERFQNRHRRGASMSKLDNSGEAVGNDGNSVMSSSLTGDALSLSSSASASPLTLRSNINVKQEETKVKLRARDRSTSRVRDAAKRHSWSPRSSTNELTVAPPLQQQTHTIKPQQQTDAARPPMAIAARRSNTTTTTTTSKPPPKGNANIVANRTQFTPRSTAMQLALQKIDMLLPQAPLGAFVRSIDDDVDDADVADDISEAGTYTLDGDNYTEEQKDLMNIDKSLRRQAGGRQLKHEQQRQQEHKNRNECAHLTARSPTSPLNPDLSATKIPIRTCNVLEVNYFHNEDEVDETSHNDADDDDDFYVNSSRLKSNASQSAAADLILVNNQTADAYLDKLRSRVLRNLLTNHQPASINQPPSTNTNHHHHQQEVADAADIGCFTSVTTSGVLAKQSTLDPRPKLNRKNSLTTSQIDSSEYVSNEMKLKNAPTANVGGGYTDHQKAEYRLNLFTNQKDLKKYAATRNLIETPPETPMSTTTDKLPSDTAALTMAQNKNDWIQQWARNARARSEAAVVVGKQQQQQHLKNNNIMTRSYNCGSGGSNAIDGSLTDDSLYNSHQLNQQRFIDSEFDYSSDPTLMCSTIKPPKSPSKIPSPLHTIGRARSASRTRGSLQGLLCSQEHEIDENNYLQKTAAAINNLQQSISRKNSLKSPTDSISSPRRRITTMDNNNASADDSPLHSIESDGYRNVKHTNRHRRNLSNESYATAAAAAAQAQLMTSSFNEQQLQLLTSGEYLMKQMHMRKNSFDGNICSPRRRVERVPEQQQQQQQATISPLHRAGSFSMKANITGGAANQQRQRAARPQYQNIYTPPAARQGGGGGYMPSSAVAKQQAAPQVIFKKSASSNNFRQAYDDNDDDYDDNLSYYINDADDDDLCVADVGDDDDDDDDEYVDKEIYGDYNDGGYGPRTITLHAANLTDDAAAHNATQSTVPLTTTRYNKALLMRIERSKQRVAAAAGNKSLSAPAAQKNISSILGNSVAGLIACPNTPELPRRNVKSARRAGLAGTGGTARQSVPRDASLSRLASQVPNSLASAKHQLLQTAAAGVPVNTNIRGNQRVQPKYLDISKYKPAQGNAFLRKNESKSTLKTPAQDGGIKRSPSSSGISRTDPTRASNRSIRSVMTSSCTGAIGGSGACGNVSRASSAVRRDDSVSKQKEIEMAMWKRRSTYDPLKAAAEDRRRKEEAKRLAIAKNANEVLCESTTLESQQ